MTKMRKSRMETNPVVQRPPNLDLMLANLGGILLLDSAKVDPGHPPGLVLHPSQLRLLHQRNHPVRLDPKGEYLT